MLACCANYTTGKLVKPFVTGMLASAPLSQLITAPLSQKITAPLSQLITAPVSHQIMTWLGQHIKTLLVQPKMTPIRQKVTILLGQRGNELDS
jgi:ABC-type transport system involved in cytochrome bd biosynthesis fused ATPase/permease subunit